MTDDPDVRMAPVGHGLPVPPPGAGLPARRRRAPSSASSPPRSAPPRSAVVLRRSPGGRRGDVDVEGLRPVGAGRTAPVVRRAPARRARRRSCSRPSWARSADAPLCITCGTKMRPAGSLLRLRGLRQHQRLQLVSSSQGMSSLSVQRTSPDGQQCPRIGQGHSPTGSGAELTSSPCAHMDPPSWVTFQAPPPVRDLLATLEEHATAFRATQTGDGGLRRPLLKQVLGGLVPRGGRLPAAGTFTPSELDFVLPELRVGVTVQAGQA